ncbi:glycosyltransferase [Anaeromyxobacter diazotrophicus]|uniref:Glycosyl transferase n=1 Tax=Anaeromyxobacter diazotrophicus TaxID=2590199 RepID=A0A7I9VIZ5_9BACT|nr:glycosyltransferase family 2 protein [Anaeromyxobacter diazotrophicus]GEJ56381.1 glycosyl transferase [Anaeromyxobacter diazotrophicus]
MPSDVWIVVVNWNGEALLPRCLGALARLSRPAHTVVVDNGSTDGSAAAVARFPSVEWLPLGQNTGFAAANNAALRRALAAGARFVATVNPDVELAPDWLDQLVAAAEAHPEAGLLGGTLLFADDPSRVNSTGLVLDRYGRAFDRDFQVPLAELRRPDGPVAGVTGGAALLRADMLRKVGLFDPGYWAYYEDVDLSFRAAAAGFGSWYAGAARALHGFGKSFGADSPRRRQLLARNHLRFAAAHLPAWRAAPVALGFTALRALVRAPLELARGRPAHALAHWRGAAEGAVEALGAAARRVRGGSGVPSGAETTDP